MKARLGALRPPRWGESGARGVLACKSASSNRRSEVGAQGGHGRSDAYKGPVVELEPDPGSMFIIWARAGAL